MCSHVVTPGGGWTQLNTSVQHQDVRKGEVALCSVLYRVTIVTTGLMMELFNQRISPSMSLSAWTNENYQKNVPLWPQWRSTRRAREKKLRSQYRTVSSELQCIESVTDHDIIRLYCSQHLTLIFLATISYPRIQPRVPLSTRLLIS